MNHPLDQLARHCQSDAHSESTLPPAALAALRLIRAEKLLTRLPQDLIGELVGWAAFALLMGNLLWSQRNIYALLSHIYAVVMLALTVREWVAARDLDLAAPVTLVQQRLEALSLLRIFRLKFAILGGIILWAPLAFVLFEALSGRPLAINNLWLIANLVFGVLIAVATVWLLRLYPQANRIARALSGESIAEAERALAQLHTFQSE